MSYLFQATGVENPKSCERWNLSVLFEKTRCFRCRFCFFLRSLEQIFLWFLFTYFLFRNLKRCFDGKSDWIKVFFLLRLENPSQIMVITCGYPTLISQQLDIWDTPRNCWVPKCWIQLDINSLFLHVDLFFGMTWTHWYLTQTQTQMGVDTTDLDIPSQIKGFDHYPNTPRKLAEWRAPFKVTVLIDVFVNDGTGRSWHEDACFKAVLIVFRCSTFAHHLLKTENCWKQMLTLVQLKLQGNLAPSPVPHSNFPAAFHTLANGANWNISRTLSMPIGVEDYKKRIKQKQLLISSTHPW